MCLWLLQTGLVLAAVESLEPSFNNHRTLRIGSTYLSKRPFGDAFKLKMVMGLLQQPSWIF